MALQVAVARTGSRAASAAAGARWQPVEEFLAGQPVAGEVIVAVKIPAVRTGDALWSYKVCLSFRLIENTQRALKGVCQKTLPCHSWTQAPPLWFSEVCPQL